MYYVFFTYDNELKFAFTFVGGKWAAEYRCKSESALFGYDDEKFGDVQVLEFEEMTSEHLEVIDECDLLGAIQ